uniref:Nudix hydrolase domain-containing protein n=1 Tax=Aplanochytrium stocchinoi TaxID=215587 RepID=A0A7S3LPY2_9STRA
MIRIKIFSRFLASSISLRHQNCNKLHGSALLSKSNCNYVYLESLYAKQEYRPVGVFILTCCANSEEYDNGHIDRYLIVRSAKTDREVWSFPQGGIDRGETFRDNFYRELSEELGMVEDQVDLVKTNFLTEEIDFDASRARRCGFSKGKAYFFSQGMFDPESSNIDNMHLDKQEIAEARWVTADSAIETFYRTSSKAKANLQKKAIEILQKLDTSEI